MYFFVSCGKSLVERVFGDLFGCSEDLDYFRRGMKSEFIVVSLFCYLQYEAAVV